MHEVGLMQDCLEQALTTAREAGARRIIQVGFAVAEGSHLTPETIRSLFAAFSIGTSAEGAEVAVTTAAARGTSAHENSGATSSRKLSGTDRDDRLFDPTVPELCLESIVISEASVENECA